MSQDSARSAWNSSFPDFEKAKPARLMERLQAYVADASPEQRRAWRDSIEPLQDEVREVLDATPAAQRYSAILEYELPLDARRPDVILLVGGTVVILELKGKLAPSQADLDQVAAYARDLRCYHRECADRQVIPVLVPTRATGYVQSLDGIHVVGPDALDRLLNRLAEEHPEPITHRESFLAQDAYQPLPTLVEAARELFNSGTLRAVHRARAATDPAVETISGIVHRAARARTRHLVLVSGVPGAGKTLVGLRAVHAHFLDDLAVPRASGKPTAPAVFLSGNGPLVQVLQYELREAGGGGQTFVRPVKHYVRQYSRPGQVPPHHVLVFDEAQRAFDANMMRITHGDAETRSEPQVFIELAEKIPEWCVVIGLIGSGQEIHVGEEAGVKQWYEAIAGSKHAEDWTVHGPEPLLAAFGPDVRRASDESLSLDAELRFHVADDLHGYVADVLAGAAPATLRPRAAKLELQRFHLRITRSLDTAKHYLWERYAEDHEARFGLVASSKDTALEGLGVPNDFQSTKRVRFGPWYGDPQDDESRQSCRLLQDCVTEFGAQGLELDATLLAWGTDLARRDGRWTNENARGYQRRGLVRDALQLRLNSYRVLLTRGRDACVVFVPPLSYLDETFEYLIAAGFRHLEDHPLIDVP